MPRLEDIDRFSKNLLSLGSEPSVLARWGEEPETELPAAEQESAELESLLHGFPGRQDEEQPPDAGDFDFGIDADDPGADDPGERDLSAGDMPHDIIDEDFEAAEDFSEVENLGAAEDFGGTASGEPDEDFDDSFLQDFAASMDSMEQDEAGPDDQGDVFEGAKPAAAPDDQAALPGEPAPDDGFELPDDFGSFDFDDADQADADADADADAYADADQSGAADDADAGFDADDLVPPAAADLDAEDGFDPGADFDAEDGFDAGADFDGDLEEVTFGETGDAGETPETGETPEAAETGDAGDGVEIGDAPETAETGDAADAFETGDAGESLAFDPGEFEIDDEIDELSLGELSLEAGEPAVSGEQPGGAEVGDDFDTAGFAAEEAEPGGVSDEMQGFGDEDEDADELLEVDEFSLGDFGAGFGITDEQPVEADEDDLNPAVAISEAPPVAVDAAGPEVELSDDEFAALQRSLADLPLNVKMAVEEIIGENSAASGEIEKLIRQLVRGEAPKIIAATAGRILGKQLRLPRGYEKRTGRAYEEQRRTLGYQFRAYVWPVLRVVVGSAVIAGLLGFAAYSYVWQPLHARGIYLSGLEHLAEGRYPVANERFAQAETFWRARRWYYRYAEAFIDQRQYGLAVEKYDRLLEQWPRDERGILDYARLESQILGNHARAEQLLQRLLDEEIYHYNALLAAGDNYMEWALQEPGRYEDARASYARLIGRYGDTDELLMRMLHYFIRTDNYREVQHLKNVFEADRRATVDPLIYAELGGYLLDYRQPADVFDILMRANARAQDLDEVVPEVHYHFARYYRMVENPVDEARALRNSRLFLESIEPLNRRRLGMLIDTYGRLGEYHYERDEFLDAEELFRGAIRRYEDARARNLLQPDATFGRIYAGLGQIHYYVERNWDEALRRFEQAEENGLRDRELSYRKGFVHYRRERYERALDEFFNAAEGHTTNPPLLFATANALYHGGNYYAAEGYYTELLDEMYRRRARIDTLLPDEDPWHRALIEYLIRTQNNLGVAYGAIARRETAPDMRRRAMEHLQASQELAVNYRRDPRTGARAQLINLSYLNLRDILYPLEEFDPQIYSAIPLNFGDLDF
ncbi:MAG: hypothetical protein EA384_01065 [Spirochaetaceae bacterium]|nr:MAG: hypothetical protein EA384_01065 [Spirochaetaceae bacterium]